MSQGLGLASYGVRMEKVLTGIEKMAQDEANVLRRKPRQFGTNYTPGELEESWLDFCMWIHREGYDQVLADLRRI